MVKRWILVLALLACLSAPSWGADISPGSREAALELLKLTAAENLRAATRSVYDARIQENPKLAPYRESLLEVFDKTIWETTVSRLADFYARTFTEPELREIIAFYKSPVGQKMLAQAPALLEEERKLVQQLLAEHTGKLEEMIRAQAKEAAPQTQQPPSASSSAKPGPQGQAPAETLLDRANRLYDTEQWAEARDAYVEYLKSEPENVDALTDLGTCYREVGDPEGALREYDRALALAPEHWQALYNKVVVLAFELKRNAEAKALLSRLRALQPHNADVEKLAAALAE